MDAIVQHMPFKVDVEQAGSLHAPAAAGPNAAVERAGRVPRGQDMALGFISEQPVLVGFWPPLLESFSCPSEAR